MERNEDRSMFLNEIILTLTKHNYELREKIGEGGFASVYKCRNNKYNEIFCVKIIELPEDSKHSLAISFDSEFQTLVKIIHPNIISLFDHFTSQHCLYLILEYCPNGSLSDLIKQIEGPIDYPRLIDLYQQILQATNYIHSIGIAHRDIKPQNILFDIHNRPKLADFGLAEFFQRNQKERDKFGGSLPYMAPELIKFNEFSPESVDVWALGISFYQMATGSLPWISHQIQVEIMSGFICYPPEMDEQILFLLRKMLQPEPSKRASCKQLLELPIFNKTNSINTQHLPPLTPLKQVSYFSPVMSSRYHDGVSTSSPLVLPPQSTKRRRRITGSGSGSSIFFKKRISLSFTFSGSESNSNTPSENTSDSLLK